MLARQKPGVVLAFLVVAAAAAYALIYLDVYVLLLMTPFLLLGCARGKHPLVLLALASVPVLFLFLGAVVKYYLTGLTLIAFDRFFLQVNMFMLAYNDWRLATALILIAAGTLWYTWALLSGRGPFTRFEKRSAAVFGAASLACVVTLHQTEFDFWDWQSEIERPSVKTFVKSFMLPDAQLHLPASATASAAPSLKINARTLGAPAEGLPNLVYILQESTFDPKVLEPTFEPRELFSMKTPLSGPLHVHTFGGGTWMSEFSIITQQRPQEFGNGGVYVFHQLEGRFKRSLFTLLNDIGYRTVVIYSVPGYFLNAEHFYRSVGAREFYDPITLGISKGWDWTTPDDKFYAAVQQKLAESDSRPTAVFMLTIAQHGPHDLNDPIPDFLSRYKKSDAAYGAFLDHLKASGRKTGVVVFGDHQPEFMASILPDDERRDFTAYEIRCLNFTCKNLDASDRPNAPLDIALLTSVSLAHFGFQLDDLSRFQLALFGQCNFDVAICDEDRRLSYNQIYSEIFN